jgi:hypothetical protein
MIEGTRFVHTDLIARDWRKLALCHTDVYGRVLVPPERKYSGPILEAGTGVPGAALQGVHLRLPGNGPDGSTLEIFTYSKAEPAPRPEVCHPGFGHLAFQVAPANGASARVIQGGGAPLGEIDTLTTATGDKVTWCHVADPEGNILELQSWS